MSIEIWKDVEGFEGRYKVSNIGRAAGPMGLLHPSISHSSHGFKVVVLCEEGGTGRYGRLLHRLIAQAFIPNPNNYADVDHLNFDKLDNRVENLEWVNDAINNNRLYQAGRMKNTFASIGRILCIETNQEFKSMKACADEMNLPYASINYCVRGQKNMTQVRGYHFQRII